MGEEWEELEGPGSMVPYRVTFSTVIPHEPPDPLMTCIFTGLTIAYAAFCVWLVVRTINRRERWAKRTLAVLVMLPVLYVLSFGPAWWMGQRDWLSDWALEIRWRFYYPLRHLPECWADDLLWDYLMVWD